MKLYLVHRNDSVDYDEYESAIVVAESQEDAIQMLKTSLEEKYGEGQEWMWGNFNVTVKEVDLNEQKIILQMLCGG
jgi:inorganic pyrophosphatase/exopolyphosphatase